MLNLLLETNAISRRLGFRGVRRLEGGSGGERFGVLELAGGGLAAVLELQGRNFWLEEPEELAEVCAQLAATLPDYPLQFLLSRRRANLAAVTGRWRERAVRLDSQLGEAEWFLRGLKEGLLPGLRGAGVFDVRYAVAVGADKADVLADRVAELFTRLPFEPRPLLAEELTALLDRLLRAADQPEGDDRRPATTFWQLAPPFPSADGGWAWRLMEFPELQGYEYDLSVFICPAGDAEQMGDVLARQLDRLESEDDDAAGLRNSERQELRERLALLRGRREGLRETLAVLALHAGSEQDEQESHQPGPHEFARAMTRAEINARRLTGRGIAAKALRASLPLARFDGLSGHTLPGWHAAEVALLPVSKAQAPATGTVIGISRDHTLLRVEQAAGSAGNLLLAGGGDQERRALARHLALQQLLDGAHLLGSDPSGEWAAWVEQAGGRYSHPGGSREADRLDLLSAPLPFLNRPEFFETWVSELSILFGLLLHPDGADREIIEGQVGAALLQTAMRSLEAGDTSLLNLAALHANLRAGGYEAADGIAQLIDGPAAGLFAAPKQRDRPANIIFIGPTTADLPPEAGRLAAQLALRRFLWTATPNPPRTHLLIDGPALLLEHPETAADLLAMVARHDSAARTIWLLLSDDEIEPLLAHPAGPGLLDRSATRAILSPATAIAAGALRGLVGSLEAYARLGAALGLPPRQQAQINLLDKDQALVCHAGGAWVVDLVSQERE